MIRYIIIYTMVIGFGRHPKYKTYAELTTDKNYALRVYEDRKEECVCDSTEWSAIRERYTIIKVEFDSIKTLIQ